tara:strand:- start:191 stop:496 length:306 start_codon:yes stop_codon:yes gene_type:complete
MNTIEKDDIAHIDDLRTVLLEENWIHEHDGNMTFRKNGTDYDRIIIQKSKDANTFNVTIPLPSTSGAFRTRIAHALDVFLYVTTFIEYYAETTLRQLNSPL